MEILFYFLLSIIASLLIGFEIGRGSTNIKMEKNRIQFNKTIDDLDKELRNEKTKVMRLQHLEHQETMRKEKAEKRKKLREQQKIQDKRKAEKKFSGQAKKSKNKQKTKVNKKRK